ncbi:uncharacterized protein CTHT_0039700 [Thermochaetoides thermophila DSM 1495]|uniref:Microbial-type PARG catalytic domain-containing protein n=1 Tax=Chaetomium thermophilum (strain DSM 1495 / CBS 144.50 / IMI 039719) TaxID=759272 RepID=G0S4C6_CHATD|nr:hypothetical protein CTHT_0039700 [Thermochaetoides thermophila DSM 1495]EGS22084.1 hypothetical protein CTHT_0039700 [Thermochaetoides thermophila DSM 1495]
MLRKKYYNNPKRLALAAIAKETSELTLTVAASLPRLNPTHSEKLSLETLPALDPAKCPRFKLPDSTYGTRVRVFNQDTFDAALSMPAIVLGISSFQSKATQAKESEILTQLQTHASLPDQLNATTAPRVAVLNMASEFSPGGGWLKGSTAQEEALCYRSTLAASLHKNMYPMAPRTGHYTRDVVVFREGMDRGHTLLIKGKGSDGKGIPDEELPVASVLSIAGVRKPAVKGKGEVDESGSSSKTDQPAKEKNDESPAKSGESRVKGHFKENWKDRKGQPEGNKPKIPKGDLVFADPAVRALTKDKMRLCLRMAASKGHTMLVLGAIGCGAFGNPPREVAACWMEVLSEREFEGGWFKEIWFAVYDRRKEGNFEIFSEVFDGKVVGQPTTP